MPWVIEKIGGSRDDWCWVRRVCLMKNGRCFFRDGGKIQFGDRMQARDRSRYACSTKVDSCSSLTPNIFRHKEMHRLIPRYGPMDSRYFALTAAEGPTRSQWHVERSLAQRMDFELHGTWPRRHRTIHVAEVLWNHSTPLTTSLKEPFAPDSGLLILSSLNMLCKEHRFILYSLFFILASPFVID